MWPCGVYMEGMYAPRNLGVIVENQAQVKNTGRIVPARLVLFEVAAHLNDANITPVKQRGPAGVPSMHAWGSTKHAWGMGIASADQQAPTSAAHEYRVLACVWDGQAAMKREAKLVKIKPKSKIAKARLASWPTKM